MLALTCFGTPQITIRGEVLDTLRRKNRAILWFVAAHQHPVARDQLLVQFWPDHERHTAQQAFRTTLYELRKALGSALIADHDTVRLAANATIDVRIFAAGIAAHATDRAALETTLALYRGDFLAGFTLPDTPEFDDWASAERERYRLLAIQGLATLARLYEATNERAAALDALDAALRLDPLREELYITAMRLRYALGDRVGAIRQFETLRRMLDAELGVAPLPATRAVYDAIIADQPPIPAQPPTTFRIATNHPTPGDQPRFAGRTGELQRLAAALAAGRLALIEGEPGIGKTRLAEEWLARHPALLLRGAAHELAQRLPYQPVIEALRGLTRHPEWPAQRARLQLAPFWLREAARLTPELTDDPQHLPPDLANETQLWEGVARLIAAVAQRGPVLVLIDDLHWADTATLGLIEYLARQPNAAVQLICTSWSVEATAPQARFCQALARVGRLERVMLGPPADTELHTLIGGLAPWLVAWISETSEGNPFFATELLRFARASGWLDRTQPPPMLQTAALPTTISDLVATRLGRLSEPARRVLDLAAVVGREFSLDLIVRASRTPEFGIYEACDELRSAGLVQPAHDEYLRFDHSLTLDSVVRGLSVSHARALHRQVAEVLVQTATGHPAKLAGTIAEHYLAGNALQHAAPFALQAGQFAVRLAAWSQAIAFFEQVLGAEVAELRVPALVGLCEAYLHAGYLAVATETGLAAIAAIGHTSTDYAIIDALYESLLQALILQGRYTEVIALGEALLRDGPPQLALCAEYLISVGLNVSGADLVATDEHLDAAETLLAAPRTYTSHVTLALIQFQRANAAGQRGQTSAAIELLHHVQNLVRADPHTLNLQMQILLHNQLAFYLHQAHDPAAVGYAQAGLALARAKGSLTHQSYLLSTSGEIALARGDLDAAEQFFREGLSVAEQLNNVERIAGQTANLGLIAQRRNQPAHAREQLQRAYDLAASIGAQSLAAQIGVWLVPLLPPTEFATLLAATRARIEAGGYALLRDALTAVMAQLPPN